AGLAILQRFLRQWSLDELVRSEDSFLEIVNGIVIQVADELDHPLGPTMFDKYMRSFASPAERDRVWSIPRKMYDGYGLSMYYEHDAIKHLPLLHNDDKWNQMPLVLAWCLSSVSNLRRRHCRNELVRWALLNPSEYADLFGHFCTCDDPQMREDLFAIAEEVVCQGKVDVAVKRRFANTVLDAVFRRTDKPGNRNAALRYYGRILVENCLEDGIIEQDEAVVCRPPYGVDAETCTLPIFTEAANSDRMGGYGPIHYDLARYVLVDKLESAFGLPRHIAKSCNDNDDVLTLVEKSAELAGIDAPSFEGWAISATYQYLLDHGYDPDVFEGPVNAGGYRVGGIDRKIARSFGEADHGSQSTVMTVAEKYVWCARNEICGYMADRVPVYTSVWQNGTDHETRELATDYGNLLSFQSPLFETTINRLSTERAEITPSFPAAFSCDNGDEICSEQELNEWIGSGNVDAITALLDHVPNIKLSLEGGIIPIAIYVSDWGVCGKQARAWAYCGAMDHTELSKLSKAGTVAIDGYDHASAFVSGISIEATYISPVEFISAPWVREYDGDREQSKIADLHVVAVPLSGSGVDSLTEIGDCWYRFPSKLAVSLCDVTRTDGARYFDTNDRVMFEDVDYGEPYKKHYQTLYADKNKLFDALGGRGLHPVWYATLQRNGNRLAGERLPQVDARFEASWLIWISDEGEYCSCRMSDEYPIPEHTNDPSDFIKELLESYASSNEEDAESPTE
ncbi:hypothetical protein, partial [Adlercreutzia sp.]|uniref:hypothetical protein n=1 Tax=Adlercreutzia sp. TaxID=1872387 RepID=UPI003FD7BFC8